jgi:uncharacterized protein (DUF488 family)
MDPIDEQLAKRRAGNAKALSVFGKFEAQPTTGLHHRTVREGAGPKVYTIGYEKRSAGQLSDALSEAGVETLVDVRDNPNSRRAEFRPDALRRLCRESGLRYRAMHELGAPKHQRDQLHETHDLGAYLDWFRAYAKRSLGEEIDKLADLAKRERVALMCYERAPEDCHRSVLAEILGARVDASVIAIL